MILYLYLYSHPEDLYNDSCRLKVFHLISTKLYWTAVDIINEKKMSLGLALLCKKKCNIYSFMGLCMYNPLCTYKSNILWKRKAGWPG